MLRSNRHAFKSNSSRRAASPPVFEALESRELMSGSALAINPVAVWGGTQLQITGTSGNDKITVTQTAGGLVVANNGWASTYTGACTSLLIRTGAGNDSASIDPSVYINSQIFAGSGTDTLQAGSGNDTLYAGTGKDTLRAGSGNDTLVSLGGSVASLYGGSGKDSFWCDNNANQKVYNVRADENAYGAVHRVSTYFGGSTTTTRFGKTSKASASKMVTAISPALPEPASTSSSITYQNFSNRPLFAPSGPSPDDIKQGQIGDCYFLSVLSDVARTDPMKIQQSILDLGDGTYLVNLVKNGQNVFVHVDASLPVLWANQPAYADFGTNGSMWTAIMEKAWTYVRGGAPSYNGISSGWMDEAFASLGASASDVYSATSGQALLTLIQSQLTAGKAVTYATSTPVAGAPLVGDHAYSVVSVVTGVNGVATGLVLRNPWGVDGAGNDVNPNDGYVTINGAQALGSLIGIVSAYV